MSSKPYVRESEGVVTIGNDFLELGFDARLNGALVSILDKESGYQFQRDPDVPKTLFGLELRKQEGRSTEWIDSREAGQFGWEKTEEDGKAVLALKVSTFPKHTLSVEVQVTVSADSALSSWRMRVTGVESDHAVYSLACPVLAGLMKLGEGVPGEALVTPRQSEGCLFNDPYPVVDRLPLRAGVGPDTPRVGMGEMHGRYPGAYPIQLMLYYNDQAGLYFACHDSGQHVKDFNVGKFSDWGLSPVMSISHLPSEVMGGDVAFDYETVVGVFHGDWHDGADLYKEWATQQWWCEKKLCERDLPDWMRTGVGVFQMSNYHLPEIKLNHPVSQIVDVVNGLSADAGVPILALIFNFESGGGWTGPAGFFPFKEGDEVFKREMARLREAGNHGFVYMPGGNFYIAIDSYDPPFDSWAEFEKEGRPNAVMNANLEVPVSSWYSGWHSARVCPQTEFTKEMTLSLFLGSLERGCTAVQIDNFPCGGADACYDRAHGHPMGFGPWWSECWNRILAETRRRAREIEPNFALATEGISENFIPYIDLYDQRGGNMEYFGHWPVGGPMGSETIPLFGYIYTGYIGAYLAAYPECNRPEVLYWTRSLGKSLAHGVVPTGGWYYPEPDELNPITLDFYKKVTRAAAQECWRYIMFGEMLRPPEIDVPRIAASYLKMRTDVAAMDNDNRHVVEDDAVQCSAWRAADGTVACFFINISEEEVAFTADLSAYCKEGKTYDIAAIVDGDRTTLVEAGPAPSAHRVTTAPLSVTVIEVKETCSG